ncbi:MAG: peptidylprolyl isomerase [Chloroflexi bacterium]|nr:peptidylprolyl isomerase [Chloroflexota bacterium]
MARPTALAVAATLAVVAFVACGGGSADSTETPAAPDLAASAPTGPTATPTPEELIAGVWEGTLTIQGNPVPLKIVFYDDPQGVTATITVLSQGVADFPLTNVRLSPAFESTRVEFDFPEIEAVWVGGLRGDAINGDFYQPDIERPAIHAIFELKRVGDAPARPAAGATVPAGTEVTPAVRDGDAVSVHYKGTLDSGEVFDSSEGKPPLSFTVGTGQVIPGFDAAVRGMFVGDTVTVRIEPENAYGEHRDNLIIDVPASDMPAGLKPGDRITSQGGATAIVVEVTADVVSIDANHELAGEVLTFEIELVSIR